MAVYRSDQAQLTISAEAAPGGAPELISGTLVGGSSDIDTTLSAEANAGDTQITVTDAEDVVVGDFIRIGGPDGAAATIGTDVTEEFEIRRIVHTSATDGAGTYYLDRPLAFYHASGDTVEEVSATNTTSNEFYSYITTVPGVYDSVTLPEFTPTIEPRYLLGKSSNRNFTTAYSGSQSFNGSLPSFVVVDATPLRFPIGKMKTNPSAYLDSSDHTSELQTAAKKGDVWINLKNNTNLDVGGYLHITDETGTAPSSTTAITSGTNPEVVKVQSTTGSSTSTMVQLSQPLRHDHAVDVNVQEVAASPYYTHTIAETFDLDTLTWNVLFRDSSETAANDLQRRYIGGMVDSATLSASEGGMLMMSYDSVPF